MIQLINIILQRGPKRILDGTSATIHPGQHIGVIGQNGAGKTSFFQLLTNELHVDGGDLLMPQEWRISYMRQEPASSTLSAVDFVLSGDTELTALQAKLNEAEQHHDPMMIAKLHEQLEDLDGYTARARAEGLLNGLGFLPGDSQKKVSEFSGGWRIRLNLANALMCPSDLLLLDEPTNHLDLDATVWLENYLRRYPGTLLVISHDRDFIDAIADHIFSLENNKINIYRGNYSAYEEQRAQRIRLQQALYAKQQKRIDAIHSFVSRFGAKATKARQAQSRVKELSRMELVAPAHADSPFDFSFPANDKVSDPLIDLRQCNCGYADHTILQKVSVSLRPNSRIGLLGRNGAGKSTLIKTLAGLLPPLLSGKEVSGERILGEHTRIGYFAQHQVDTLDLSASPLLQLQRIAGKTPEQKLRDFLGKAQCVGAR